MKKGFTLIELLGVIIIIALLSLITFPSIINVIKGTNDKIDSETLKIVYNSVDIYISQNINDFPKIEGNKYIIDIEDIFSLETFPSELSNNDKLKNKCIQVVYDDEFKYELRNVGEC